MNTQASMTTPTARKPTLHRVARRAGELAVADYPGDGPTVVAMHGFPDHRSINEPLAHQLAGRRVLLFDFLGYGQSDKPTDHAYDAASCEDDLDAVISELTDGPVVVVAHDASGPTAINWAQRNPERTEHLVLLNCYYHQTPSLHVPEIISLFAAPATRPLTTALAADQGLLLLAFLWQGAAFAEHDSARGGPSVPGSAFGRGRARWRAVLTLAPYIARSPTRLGVGLSVLGAMFKWRLVPTAEQLRWVKQFTATRSTIPAFLGWTGDLHHSIESNTTRSEALRAFDRPVTVAFGKHDPYLTPALAHDIAALFTDCRLELLDAGHWPQLELPNRVAEILTAPRSQVSGR